MNETPMNKTVILTIDYEFIPASSYPESFQNLISVWLDVGGCGDSDVPVQENATTFLIPTPLPWTASSTSRIIFAEGHLHDAGTHLEILRHSLERNKEGEVICDSIATYGGTPGFIEQKEGIEHISNMTSCGGDVPSRESNIVDAGVKFDLRAYYDFTKRPGMREADGTLAPVMGIAILYLAPGV